MTLKKRYRKLLIFSIAIVIALLILTCIIGPTNVSYLSQAISGHFRIMSSRVSIEKILEKNELNNESLNKLKMVLNVREYASKELGLPENRSYTLCSKIDGKYLGWNVYCCPKFSVEPKKWCFPIAGCVFYRGYFLKEQALKFSKKMQEKGFDVFVGPFNAYSTLGWYNDPLLSSHLLLDSIHLAGIIIHELAHQKFYISGDSRFNESFAVTVERAGVLRWLKSLGRDEQIIQALKMWDEDDKIASRILKARSQLNEIYNDNLDSISLSYKKDSIFKSLKVDICNGNCSGIKLPKTNGEDFEFNNAYFVPINIYYSLIPNFKNILDSCGGNFTEFFEKVKEIGKLPLEKRNRKIESLHN